MEIKEFLIGFVTVFVVALVVTAIVTYLWSLIVHGAGEIDWGRSFRFAIIFGIVLGWVRMKARERKKKGK